MFFSPKETTNVEQKKPSDTVFDAIQKHFTNLLSYLPKEERTLILLEIKNYLEKSLTSSLNDNSVPKSASSKRTDLTFIQLERGGLLNEILTEQGCAATFHGLYIVTPVSVTFHPDPRKKEAETIWRADEEEFARLKKIRISPWMKAIEEGEDSFLTPDRLRQIVFQSATIEKESHNQFDSTFTISKTMRFPSKYQWSRYSLLPGENQWHEVKGPISIVKFEIKQKGGRTRIRLSLNLNDRTWKGLKMWQMTMEELIEELKDEWIRLILSIPC